MNNNIWQQLKNELKMTESERQVLRSNLVNFVKGHPVRTGMQSVQSPYAVKSPFMSLARPLKFVTAFALVLILAGSGLFYAAEASLPGDALYNVKRAGEEIKLSVTNKPEARAEIYIKLTERRLSEATALTLEGKLDEEVGEELQKDIEEHTEAVREETERMTPDKAEKALEISSSLEASLKAHKTVLGVAKEKTDSNGLVSAIIETADEAADDAMEEKEVAEDELIAEAAEQKEIEQNIQKNAIAKKTQVSKELSKLKRTIDSENILLSRILIQTLDNNIFNIESLQRTAGALMGQDKYAEAIVVYQEALGEIEELTVLINLEEIFDLAEEPMDDSEASEQAEESETAAAEIIEEIESIESELSEVEEEPAMDSPEEEEIEDTSASL